MAKSIIEKLSIKANDRLRTIDAPPTFKKGLMDLPSGVKISDKVDNFDQVHWFVLNKSEMEKKLTQVLKLVSNNVICWIYYPKGTSKLQTDLTRDKGWDKLLKEKELQWVNLISFDDTWSVFGFRRKTAADKKKDEKPAAPREIFNWVNPSTKEVKLPDDFATVLKKNKSAANWFNELSFTNKKEYLEWIVTAKKEETRNERIKGTIERLNKNWKNPRNI